MNHYTSTIPLPLAEKLKKKGMPIEMQPLYAQEAPNARGIVKAGVGLWCPSFAEVFDWFMSEKGLHIVVEPYWDFANEIIDTTYEWSVVKSGTIHADTPHSYCPTWHEAAEAAIGKALTLI